jgi:hypothetical protein
VLLRLREDYEQAVLDLFEADQAAKEVLPALDVVGHTSNFLDNIRLPVHRWFRYSAGFSAEWVKWLLAERDGGGLRVLDPFVGSGTTCLACDEMGVPSHGIEAHPFVHRVAQAKLSYNTDPERFTAKAESAFRFARKAVASTEHYPEIIAKCYGLETLDYLDRFRQAVQAGQDGSPEAQLLWMALVSSLRVVCDSASELCFVIGDSAPYGVYVPVIEWFGKLAPAEGFESWTFQKLRDRDNKWKNRKHRVPLCEGHLWVRG